MAVRRCSAAASALIAGSLAARCSVPGAWPPTGPGGPDGGRPSLDASDVDESPPATSDARAPDAHFVDGSATGGPTSCPAIANNLLAAASSADGAMPVASCERALDLALAATPSYTLALDPSASAVATAAAPRFQRCGALGEVARDIALSPDGRRLAVLAAETVRLFGTDPWREIAHLAHGTEPINGVAFSRDGSRLATLSSHRGEIALWDAGAGTLLRVYSGGVSPNLFLTGGALAFSADGRRLATALGTIVDLETGTTIAVGDGRLRGGDNSGLWFTNGDATLLARTLYRSGDSWAGTLIERFATDDGHQEATVGDDGLISADLRLAAGIGRWGGELTIDWVGTPVSSVAFQGSTNLLPQLELELARSGHLVALTNQADGLVVETADAIVVFPALDPSRIIARIPKAPGMRFVAMSPHDEIVTSGGCGTIGWSWRTGAPLWSQPFNVDRITWSADGRTAAAIGPGAFFRVLRGDTLAVLCAPPGARGIQTVISSDDGQTVAIQYDDSEIELRDGDLSPRSAPLLPSVVSPGIPVAISDGGSVLLTMANRNFGAPLTVWSLPDGRPIRTLEAQGDYRFAFSANGTRLAHGGSSGLTVVDLAGGAPPLSIGGAQGRFVGFNTDGTRIAAASQSGFAIFDTADGSLVTSFAPSDSVDGEGLALSHDWSVAVALSSNPRTPTAVGWRPPNGTGHAFVVTDNDDSVLSSDGTILATNQEIMFVELVGPFFSTTLWDVASGTVLQQFEDHPLQMTRAGRYLIGSDGALFCRPVQAPLGR